MTRHSRQSISRGFARAGAHPAAPTCVRILLNTRLLSIALLLFCAQVARAQAFRDLHNFAVNSESSPTSPWVMAEGRDNNLYGVTATGGTHAKGTIFKIGPSGGFTVLHNFDGPHGSTPVGGLTLGVDGNLYGTAEREGAYGYGNIFRITPAGAFSVIYDFQGGSDGGLPVSPLIIGADGNFYGTSYPGVAFSLTPAGVLTVIATVPTYSFGPLLQAKDGSFYGVTEFGGEHGAGTVYRIARGKSTILHSFDGPSGANPVGGLVEGNDANFYGTTTAGGSAGAGVVYRITPAGGYRVMVDWDNQNTVNGYQAYAGLIAGADGKLYGATIWGGQYGDGVIFAMTTDGGYSVLYNFDEALGNGTYATPIQHTNGKLYGITDRGGGAQDGVLYSFDDNLQPFIKLLTKTGLVGQTVGILGRGFAQAAGVEFNGTAASFRVISNTYMIATIPAGETGFVTVYTSSGPLTSDRIFRVPPQLTSFSPSQGNAGTIVTLNGSGLIQASRITIGGAAVGFYTVVSDSKLRVSVPAGAKTGRIVVTTPGGETTSSARFKVAG
jgi:uncharacterized repeat protein (TIGR03803 family)